MAMRLGDKPNLIEEILFTLDKKCADCPPGQVQVGTYPNCECVCDPNKQCEQGFQLNQQTCECECQPKQCEQGFEQNQQTCECECKDCTFMNTDWGQCENVGDTCKQTRDVFECNNNQCQKVADAENITWKTCTDCKYKCEAVQGQTTGNCIQDANGPFNSEKECQDSGCGNFVKQPTKTTLIKGLAGPQFSCYWVAQCPPGWECYDTEQDCLIACGCELCEYCPQSSSSSGSSSSCDGDLTEVLYTNPDMSGGVKNSFICCPKGQTATLSGIISGEGLSCSPDSAFTVEYPYGLSFCYSCVPTGGGGGGGSSGSSGGSSTSTPTSSSSTPKTSSSSGSSSSELYVCVISNSNEPSAWIIGQKMCMPISQVNYGSQALVSGPYISESQCDQYCLGGGSSSSSGGGGGGGGGNSSSSSSKLYVCVITNKTSSSSGAVAQAWVAGIKTCVPIDEVDYGQDLLISGPYVSEEQCSEYCFASSTTTTPSSTTTTPSSTTGGDGGDGGDGGSSTSTSSSSSGQSSSSSSSTSSSSATSSSSIQSSSSSSSSSSALSSTTSGGDGGSPSSTTGGGSSTSTSSSSQSSSSSSSVSSSTTGGGDGGSPSSTTTSSSSSASSSISSSSSSSSSKDCSMFIECGCDPNVRPCANSDCGLVLNPGYESYFDCESCECIQYLLSSSSSSSLGDYVTCPTCGGSGTVSESSSSSSSTCPTCGGSGTVPKDSSSSSSSSTLVFTILENPANKTVVAGQQSTLFNVSVTSPFPITYKWQHSVDGGNVYYDINPTGGVFTGVLTDALSVNAGMTDTSSVFNNARFRCIITSNGQTLVSGFGILTVITGDGTP